MLPQGDGAYVLALGVFEFDFGFGCAGKRGEGYKHGEGDRGEGKMFHAGIITNFVWIVVQLAKPKASRMPDDCGVKGATLRLRYASLRVGCFARLAQIPFGCASGDRLSLRNGRWFSMTIHRRAMLDPQGGGVYCEKL